MSPSLPSLSLFISLCVCLAVGMAVTEDVLEVTPVLGSDCSLNCTAKPKPGVQYRAVTWYKVGESPSSRLSGLLTRDLPNGMTQQYASVGREAPLLLGESHSILLPNVTCGDAGLYTCYLAAPLGEQNREGQVLLTLTGCPESPTEDLRIDPYMAIIATAVLMFALCIFLISYVCLKNTLRDRHKTTTKETLLDAPLKPLEKKDLMLISTLGPKPTMKHVCV